MAETLKLGNGIWGTKDGSLLAYNDENGNYKPLPFDFTRASSATVVNKAGLIETVQSGIPRIDFLGNTNGALKLEPQRTNLITQSNQFDTTWINSDVNITSGYLGLDGTNSAWLLTKTATTYANTRFPVTFSGTHTFSIYLKKGTNTSAILRTTGGTSAKVEINLIDGTTSGEVNTTSVKTESMGNDWWRCSLTLNASSDTAVRIYPQAPLGGATAGNIYIQYAQLEASSYPTSYIPTQGSTVTRVADSCSQTPTSGIIGQTEGTLFIDINISQIVNTEALVTINSGGYANNTTIAKIANIIQFVRNSATQSAASILTSGVIAIGRHKIAIAYKSGDTAFYLDGTQVSTIQTETFTNGTLTTFRLGGDSIGAIPADANYNESKLYNTRLSNSELATLTSL